MTRLNHACQVVAGLALTGVIVALLPWSEGNVVAAIWTAVQANSVSRHAMAYVQTRLVVREGGHVDAVVRSGGRIFLQGWAADTAALKPARSVQIFVNDQNVASAVPADDRPDVAAAFGLQSPKLLGFKADVAAKPTDVVTVFAELNDGTFSKLHYPPTNP